MASPDDPNRAEPTPDDPSDVLTEETATDAGVEEEPMGNEAASDPAILEATVLEETETPFGGNPPDLTQESGMSIPEAKELTRQRAREAGGLLFEYMRRHLPERAPRMEEATPAMPRVQGRHAQWLPVLRAVPWSLGALFLTSFAWDFPGWEASLFGHALVFEGLLRILAVSGLIGFATNWLAITMLFQPREKRPIFGQGLVPAQRERVVYRLAQAISQELINETIIKERIAESGVIGRYRHLGVKLVHDTLDDPDFRRELKTLAELTVRDLLGSEEMRAKLKAVAVEKLEQNAGEGLGGLALKAYRKVRGDDFDRRIEQAIAELPDALDPVLDRLDALLDEVPAQVEAQGDAIEEIATRTVLGFVERLDVYAMIVENADKYDEQQLERLLKTTSNEQLNYIKYLGGLLGLVGGLVIWEPLLALGAFGTIGAVLWALDEALYRRG
ncbi:MAG: DUF445 family protein [Bacteroidota bacterium]